jgi:3'-phosphoadenosine 5'-phosphosulfate sulfotransferase (PAPS reductase)/FAD synthetase
MLDMPKNWQGEKTDEQKAELSRRATALTAGMNMTFERKVDYACRVIERAMMIARTLGVKWAISYSGGRDSTILSHLAVEIMGWNVPHVMSNTRMEYPEVLRQAAKWKKWLAERGIELATAYPDKRPAEVWAEGFPLWSKEVSRKYRLWAATDNPKHWACIPDSIKPAALRVRAAGIKVTDTCCDRLKKEPMAAWDKANGVGGHLTGVRCEESQARRLMYIQRGSMYESRLHGQWLAHPLTHWREMDLRAYTQKHGLVIDRIGRSGCSTCGFGAHLSQEQEVENSLQRLRRENPKMWKVAMDEWGYRDALTAAGVDFGQFADDQADRGIENARAAYMNDDAKQLSVELGVRP